MTALNTALSEDSIDDILYFARTNDVPELQSCLAELASQTKLSTQDILLAARDTYSKNTALHYAAGNGHLGKAATSHLEPGLAMNS